MDADIRPIPNNTSHKHRTEIPYTQTRLQLKPYLRQNVWFYQRRAIPNIKYTIWKYIDIQNSNFRYVL